MVAKKNNYWGSKRVFITGASGFIGSHLVDSLVRLGADVRALVHYNSRNDIGLLNQINPNMLDSFEVVFGDITDYNQMESEIKGSDIVFHLAALIGIPYSYNAPKSYINTNILGSYNIFQSCLKNDVEKIVHTSTSEVYGTAQYTPIDENHPLQGQSPYSASKISADSLLHSLSCSFGLRSAVVRPFNNYGPRQSSRAIIPTIITQALFSKKIILGNPSAYRDFLFVSDTINAYLKIASSRYIEAEIFNASYGKQISISDLVDVVKETIQIDKEVIFKESERMRPDKSEVYNLVGDASKIKDALGWEPEFDLRSGIKETANYIRLNQELFKSAKYRI